MGFFSKKKTYVESLAMPMVEDTPNFVQQSVLTSIKGERPIAEDLIANTINGLGSNLARYFKYGRDHYTYGIPEGTLNSNNVSPSTVEAVIDVALGTPVRVDSVVLDAPSADFFAEDHLINTRGWNEGTNEIANPPFNPGGQTVTLGVVQFTSSTNIRIQYLYGVSTYDENFTVPAVGLNDQYYQATYYELNNNGSVGTVKKWWTYQMSLGTYEVLTIEQSEPAPYYPVIPLRYNNQDFTVDDGSDRYQTSKNLLRKLDLKIGNLGDAINENPDVGDIDHAFIITGVSTQTEAQAGKDYLFEYFRLLETNSAFQKGDFDRWLALDSEEQELNTPPINKVEIKEPSLQYHVEIGYLYIVDTLTTGSIGKLGFVDTTTTVKPPQSKDSFAFETSILTCRKQINATQYQTLEVVGLNHINYVYKNYTVDTSLADAVDSAADPDVFKDGLIIPLNHNVVDGMALTKRTELAYDAIKIVFNCVTTVKLKWYQTGFFKFATIIVAIALTIYSFGSMSASIGWAAGLVGSTSVVVGAVVLGVISIGLKYGVAYLVDVLGIESGLVLAIIVAFSYALPGGYVDPNFLSLIQTGFTSGTQLAMDWEMEDITNDYDALQREMEEAQRELDELTNGLGINNLIDPMAVYNSSNGLASPDETPDQYYNTRIHFGNMASVAPLAVTNYVDNELYLEGLTVHYGIKV